MFWIRYKTKNAQGQLVDVERVLDPPPTEVDYPPARAFRAHTTQDGATVIQRPLRDNRPRSWVWRNYTDAHETYGPLWAILKSLDYRARLAAGLPGTVEVWEDVSGTDTLNRTNGSGAKVYTTVRVVQVDRQPGKGGGPVRFPESVFEFRIEDSTFTAF
jgi:hypothetical protein